MTLSSTVLAASLSSRTAENDINRAKIRKVVALESEDAVNSPGAATDFY
jgi:hypothetical protein